MENKEYLKKLYLSKTDEEVTDILSSIPGIIWKEYGNTDNNTTIINGQMNDPLRCLIENLVNGIDAVKMLKARQDGVDLSNPEDPKMPKSSAETLKRYFGIEKPLYEMNSKERNALHLVGLYIERIKPSDSSIIIYDYGEGQNPDMFEDTLLSLIKGNKASLPFVQGKYNMGSTGVLKKCNGHRYELIVSMRNLGLKDSDKKIGFTIVRYADAAKNGKKFRSYEYMTIDGKIPYVKYSSYMKDMFPGVPNFKGGCIRKLYSYNIGRMGGSGRIQWKFNSLFYDTQLPIRVTVPPSEAEDDKKRFSWIMGAKNHIENRKSGVDILLHKTTAMVLPCGEAKVEYYVFSANSDTGNSPDVIYINGHSVGFVDNGQNNGDLPRTFLSNDCNLSQITKNTMVFVDTTDLPTQEMADVYKPSRDRIDEEAPLSKLIIEQLKTILTEDDDLRKLNEEFKGKSIYNADAEKLAQNVMRSLSENENIRKLLLSENGDILKKIGGIKRAKSDGREASYVGKKKEKAVVSLKKNEEKETTIECGKSGTVEFSMGEEKDMDIASSDDIIIKISPVKLKEVTIKVKGKKVERPAPKNTYSKIVEDGKIKLLINPKVMGYYAEEKFEICFKNIHDETFNAVVTITVAEAEAKERKSETNRYDKLSGPTLCFLSKKASDGIMAWSDMPFAVTEDDVCKLIVSRSSIEKVYINLDSTLYHEKMDSVTNIDLVKSNYISNVYVQAIISYLSQASNFTKMFDEKAELQEYRDIIMEQLVHGTEESVKNTVGFAA